MRAWQFTQKTPGYGINAKFYLSVLAAKAALPALKDIVNPSGEDGAVVGFAVPIAKDAGKETLAQPIHRGAYALSTKDRKTIIKMLVVSKEEAGYDPNAFLRSSVATAFSEETRQRISATWTLLQLTFETHEPMVGGAIRFLHACARRLAELTEGVIADPITELYLLPEELRIIDDGTPKVHVEDIVRIVEKPRDHGLWIYSRGMEKLSLPEFEMFEVPAEDAALAHQLLLGLEAGILSGNKVVVGGRVGAPSCPLQIAPGGLDRGTWEGTLCYELIPPTGKTISEALRAWAVER